MAPCEEQKYAGNDEEFAKVRAARSKPCMIQTDNSLEFLFVLLKTCVGITTRQTHTHQKPKELPRTQSVK